MVVSRVEFVVHLVVGEETIYFLVGVEEGEQEEGEDKMEEKMVDHSIHKVVMSMGCVAILPVTIPNTRLLKEVVPPMVEISRDWCIEAYLSVGVEEGTLVLAG